MVSAGRRVRAPDILTRSHGNRRRAAPRVLKADLEQSWSWGESNPRPPGGHRPCYDHSRTSASTATELAGQRAARGGHRRVFPRCQRSFPPSVVFPYGPPTLLLPGCVDLAPCAIAGHGFPHAIRWLDQAARANCSFWRFFGCPRLTSLKQLGSHTRLPGPNVETSQPRDCASDSTATGRFPLSGRLRVPVRATPATPSACPRGGAR